MRLDVTKYLIPKEKLTRLNDKCRSIREDYYTLYTFLNIVSSNEKETYVRFDFPVKLNMLLFRDIFKKYNIEWLKRPKRNKDFSVTINKNSLTYLDGTEKEMLKVMSNIVLEVLNKYSQVTAIQAKDTFISSAFSKMGYKTDSLYVKFKE